jgi:uncharacterized damage-inducible protein DinB
MQSDIGPVCQLHLEFMKWADETMLAALSQVSQDQLSRDVGNSFKSLLGTLNHVYLAESVWLRRLQGNQNALITDVESPPDLTALAQEWPNLHSTWIDWSRSLASEDWPKLLIHRNSQGKEFQMPYWQLVFHLVNHGSYHRGQVATMLRQSGVTPPGTDLVTFYRTR